MTTRVGKTSPETKQFAIILSCLHSAMFSKYAATGLLCAPLNPIENKDLRLEAQVGIKTTNVVI